MAGSSSATRTPMMAITTSNSTRVNADVVDGGFRNWDFRESLVIAMFLAYVKAAPSEFDHDTCNAVASQMRETMLWRLMPKRGKLLTKDSRELEIVGRYVSRKSA